MSEQFLWHFFAICIYILSIRKLRKGLKDSTSWFCLFIAIGFSGNVLGYPLALLNDPLFIFMKDMPAAILHGQILFVALVVSWIGHFLVKRSISSAVVLKKLPELPLQDFKLDKIFRYLVLGGALLTIALSISGNYGYFIHKEYLLNPPAWFGIVKSFLAIANGLLFLVILKEFQRRKKLLFRTIILISFFIIAGFLTGFKTNVVMPGLFIVVGAWMAGRVRLKYFLLMVLLIVVAYSVVEPMRVTKWQNDSLTAFDSVIQVINSDEFSLMEGSTVLNRFMQRIDYTRTAVRTLAAYERGYLKEFKRRVDEYFLYAPIIAFVPRGLWPNKPLSNLGGVLSYELTGNARNAITPSQNVITFIWGGWFGLIFTLLTWSMLCTIGGQIIINHSNSIYKHAPFFILAIILSHGSAVMASYFIYTLRMILILIVLYLLGVIRSTRHSV